jgi:hypothetical protein
MSSLAAGQPGAPGGGAEAWPGGAASADVPAAGVPGAGVPGAGAGRGAGVTRSRAIRRPSISVTMIV